MISIKSPKNKEMQLNPVQIKNRLDQIKLTRNGQNSHGLETGLGLEKYLGVPKLTQVLSKFSATSIQEGWGAEGKLSCTTLLLALQ